MPKVVPLPFAGSPVLLEASRDAKGGRDALEVEDATDAIPAPTPADLPTVLEAAAHAVRRGDPGAMATVLARHGSAPSTPGQKLFLSTAGACVGSVGGGSVERAVLAHLGQLLRPERERQPGAERTAEVRHFRLGAELGMCCGGSVDVLIEPLEAKTPCLIVGAGHVATALAPLLARLGFGVTVVDEREAWGGEGRLEGVRSVVGAHDEIGREIPRAGAVLVMTHDHGLDQRVIEWALSQRFAFVGGVGSRAKAHRTRARLEARGYSEADRARVRMPLGVHVGARLPEEIAVAIAAELVGWRRART